MKVEHVLSFADGEDEDPVGRESSKALDKLHLFQVLKIVFLKWHGEDAGAINSPSSPKAPSIRKISSTTTTISLQYSTLDA